MWNLAFAIHYVDKSSNRIKKFLTGRTKGEFAEVPEENTGYNAGLTNTGINQSKTTTAHVYTCTVKSLEISITKGSL